MRPLDLSRPKVSPFLPSLLVLLITAACTTTSGRQTPAEPTAAGTVSRSDKLKTYAVTACRVFSGVTQNINDMVMQPLTAEIGLDIVVEGAETANPDISNCRASNADASGLAAAGDGAAAASAAQGGDCNAKAAAGSERRCHVTCDVAIETSWLDFPRFTMTVTRMSDGEILADCSGKEPSTRGTVVKNVAP